MSPKPYPREQTPPYPPLARVRGVHATARGRGAGGGQLWTRQQPTQTQLLLLTRWLIGQLGFSLCSYPTGPGPGV